MGCDGELNNIGIKHDQQLSSWIRGIAFDLVVLESAQAISQMVANLLETFQCVENFVRYLMHGVRAQEQYG
jgi:hypothetical protein